MISRALNKKTRFWSKDTVKIGCLAKKVDCSETDRVNVGYRPVKLLAPDSHTAEILNGVLLYHDNKKKTKIYKNNTCILREHDVTNFSLAREPNLKRKHFISS